MVLVFPIITMYGTAAAWLLEMAGGQQMRCYSSMRTGTVLAIAQSTSNTVGGMHMYSLGSAEDKELSK